MTQTARVVATDKSFATVEVSRKSICEGCHNMSNSKGCSACLVFGDKIAHAKAYNTIGAKVGDRVLVSASSKRMIGYSAAIFFLPIVISFIAYFILEGMIGEHAILYSLSLFALCFALACVILEKTVRKNPDLEIIALADDQDKSDTQAED